MLHHVFLTVYYDQVQELRKRVQNKALVNQEPVTGGFINERNHIPLVSV